MLANVARILHQSYGEMMKWTPEQMLERHRWAVKLHKKGVV